MLFDRAGELEAIRHAVLAVARANEGCLLAIEGAAGVGKTALLEAAEEEAHSHGVTVLSGRGSELERGFGFGVVLQLFEGVLREQSDARALLRGQAALAGALLGVTGGEPRAAEPVPDSQFAILHGLYWLTANLTERGPLALLVDDAHWADVASLRFLAYLAGRLEGLCALVCFSTRPAGGGDAVLSELLSAPAARVLTAEPLGPEATARLVREIAPDADDLVCSACSEVTGGNPCYLRELAGHLADRGATRGREARELALTATPAGVARRVACRLDALGPPVRAVAHAVVVLGDGAEQRHVAALSDVELAAVAPAADALRAVGVFDPRPPLSFAHPIIAGAVSDGMPAGARAAAHVRAARILDEAGAPAQRIASHLLACEPSGDRWVHDRLIAASAAARASGATEAAAAFLRRALLESADQVPGAQLLLRVGQAELEAVELEAATEHLEQAYGAATDRTMRLEIALALARARAFFAQASQAVAILERELAEWGEDDSIADHLLATATNYSRFQGAARVRAAPIIARLRSRAGTRTARDVSMLIAEAAEMAMAAEPASGIAPLARRALTQLLDHEDAEADGNSAYLARVLCAIEDADAAAALYEAWFDRARRRGSPLAFGIASTLRAEYHYWRGALPDAEADARAALALSLETRFAHNLPMVTGYLAAALIEREQPAEAEGVLGEWPLDRPGVELPDTYTFHVLLYGRGVLRAALADPAGATVDLLECGRRQIAQGEVNPAFGPWRSQAALALLALGDEERARGLCREELEPARRFGAPAPIGAALRAAAALEPEDARRPMLEEAIHVLARSTARLEHARALADLGQHHADAGDRGAAAEALLEALDRADRCGSSALERRVTTALRGVGLRPRRPRRSGPGALTGSERQVAELAVEGRSNREIAEALFVTVRTVEYHLGNAYRKLGVRGRAELPGALGHGRGE